MKFTLPNLSLTGPPPEWGTSADPRPMVEGLKGWRTDPDKARADSHASRRKARLFALACCERIRHLIADPDDLKAIDLLSDYTCGRTRVEELVRLNRRLRSDHFQARETDPLTQYNMAVAHWAPGWAVTQRDFVKEAIAVATDGDSWTAIECFRFTAAASTKAGADTTAELAAQADLLRCVFGDPTRPIAFDPAWRTETVVGLAAALDDGRAFGNLPILADALQDAGCEEEAVLTHCRVDPHHVRGCWVVDRILRG